MGDKKEVSGFVTVKMSSDGEYVFFAERGNFWAGYRRRYFDILDGDVKEEDERIRIVLNTASGFKDALRDGKRVNVHMVWTLQDDPRYYDEVWLDRAEVVDYDEDDTE